MPKGERGELVVGRCDKETACFVPRRWMAMFPSIAWYNERYGELEQEFEVQVVLDHIPGSENVAPHVFLRGWMDKTLQGMWVAGIVFQKRLELWERWGFWLEDLVGAAGVEGAGDEFYWNHVQESDGEEEERMGDWRK